MLEDRYYMRGEESSRFSASVIMMIVLTVVFALQNIDYVYTRFGLDRFLALSPAGLKQGFIWQLLTFQFLHASLFHLFFNLLCIWFFGRVVEQRLGTANFLKVYFAGGVTGGLLQSALGFVIPQYFGGPVMGASAGVCALIAAFALMEPEAIIMLMFVFPLKAKYLLALETGIALFFTIVPSNPGIAHAAHLGGIGAGVAFLRWGLYNWESPFKWRPFRSRARRRELVKAATLKPGFWKSKVPDAEQVEPEEFISREVDPILDKISAQGIQSLTPKERQILEAARSKMEKR